MDTKPSDHNNTSIHQRAASLRAHSKSKSAIEGTKSNPIWINNRDFKQKMENLFRNQKKEEILYRRPQFEQEIV